MVLKPELLDTNNKHESKAEHKFHYPDYKYRQRRKSKKKTVEYRELIIHTDDKNDSGFPPPPCPPPLPPSCSFI